MNTIFFKILIYAVVALIFCSSLYVVDQHGRRESMRALQKEMGLLMQMAKSGDREAKLFIDSIQGVTQKIKDENLKKIFKNINSNMGHN